MVTFLLESAVQGQAGGRSIFEPVKVGALPQGYDLEKRGAWELRQSARSSMMGLVFEASKVDRDAGWGEDKAKGGKGGTAMDLRSWGGVLGGREKAVGEKDAGE